MLPWRIYPGVGMLAGFQFGARFTSILCLCQKPTSESWRYNSRYAIITKCAPLDRNQGLLSYGESRTGNQGYLSPTLLPSMEKKLERSTSVIGHSCAMLNKPISVETGFASTTTYCSTIGTLADGLTLGNIVQMDTRYRAILRALEQSLLYNIDKILDLYLLHALCNLTNSSY